MGRDGYETREARERVAEPGTLAFVTDLGGLRFEEAAAGAVRIEVCRDGEWQHAQYGEIRVTPELRASFAANFRRNVREVGDLPLDYDHEAGPAPGWITGLVNEGPSLYAEVRLTPGGQRKVREGEYRFFSPEWHPDWKNPRTGAAHGPTLFGGALTNKPFFRGMAAIRCSETRSVSEEGREMPETLQGREAVDAQQFAELQRRLRAVEEENGALRAAEERRGLTQVFAELSFGEGGRLTLAPACRGALADALLAVPVEQREAVVAAVRGLAFAELGERGFRGGTPEDPNRVTEEQKRELLGMTPAGKASLGSASFEVRSASRD
ncbi:MAG: hypothetical protein K0Q72_2804 [Armatimonadetes bacterium]|jgi:hypothetical protein|nr:hypothetical protein [Armatimonadota bacterium]